MERNGRKGILAGSLCPPLYAVAEMEMEGTVVDSGATGAVRIGLCAVDAASGQVGLIND